MDDSYEYQPNFQLDIFFDKPKYIKIYNIVIMGSGVSKDKVRYAAKTTDQAAGTIVTASTPVVALTSPAGTAFAALQTQNIAIDKLIDTSTAKIENIAGIEAPQREEQKPTASSILAHTAYNPLVAHVTVPGKIAYNVARDYQAQSNNNDTNTTIAGGNIRTFKIVLLIVVIISIIILLTMIVYLRRFIKSLSTVEISEGVITHKHDHILWQRSH